MSELIVPIAKNVEHDDLPYPDHATSGSSGIDLIAANVDDIVIRHGVISLVPTGISMAIPEGWEGQVRARSGLALKHGLTLVNGPGTIDADYRGEIGVIVTTLKNEEFTVKRGMRIAQMVFAPVARVRIEAVDALPETRRGAGGFGHTVIQMES